MKNPVECQLLEICENCQRCSVADIVMKLVCKPVKDLSLKRNLSSLQCPSSQFVWICDECNVTLSNSTRRLNWVYIWPSYFWKLLSNNMDHLVDVWKWIPEKWRPMWFHCLVRDEIVSLEFPASYFCDISSEVKQFKDDLGSMELMKLKDALNRHPYTSVKCPWGCEEFFERCHPLPFYAFIEFELLKKYPSFKLPLSETVILYGERKKIH